MKAVLSVSQSEVAVVSCAYYLLASLLVSDAENQLKHFSSSLNQSFNPGSTNVCSL